MQAAPPSPTRTRWTARLAGAFVVALVAASVDTVLTRSAYHYRPRDFELYTESVYLWFGYALLALVPTVLADRWLARYVRSPMFWHPARATARLAVWTLAPVVAHGCLDSFTGLGGDTSRLATLEPWLVVVGVLAALVGAAWALGRTLEKLRPSLAAVSLALLAVLAGRMISFQDARHLPEAPVGAEKRPNVLLLVWDTTRAQSLSLYGYDRDTTPNLAKLAEQSVVYTNARSVSVYTLTSHISMLTGVYPSHHGARVIRQWFNPYRTPPVVDDFRKAGYRTGAFVGTDVLRAQSGVSEGFERYDDQVDPWVTYTRGWALLHDLQSITASFVPALRQNGLPHWCQDFQRPADDVLRDAREWIESDDARPWFCMVNLYDAHWPYAPEGEQREEWVRPYEGVVDGYSHRGDHVKQSNYRMTPQDKRHVADLYDGEINQLDRTVDEFLARLDLKNTALVLTSDHGEALGEGEPERYEHADMLECQTRIPLLVRPPGGTTKRVVSAPVNGVDVAPTLLALAGIESKAEMFGRNLLGELPADHPLLVEDRDHPNRHYMKLALWDGPWKLVRIGVPGEFKWRLYDTRTDANEAADLAEQHPEIVDRLRGEMDELRAKWHADDERDLKGGTRIENIDALRALGYFDTEANVGH